MSAISHSSQVGQVRPSRRFGSEYEALGLGVAEVFVVALVIAANVRANRAHRSRFQEASSRTEAVAYYSPCPGTGRPSVALWSLVIMPFVGAVLFGLPFGRDLSKVRALTDGLVSDWAFASLGLLGGDLWGFWREKEDALRAAERESLVGHHASCCRGGEVPGYCSPSIATLYSSERNSELTQLGVLRKASGDTNRGLALGSPDRLYVGIGVIDHGNGPDAETFGEGESSDSMKGSELGDVRDYRRGWCYGIIGSLRGGSGRARFAQQVEGIASDKKMS
ncbi:hypothetical protein V8E53_013083 [Lactarius tabidus]